MKKELLADKPYSSHPGDHYLRIQLFHLPTNTVTPYVTWLLNTSISEDAHCEGHYHVTLKEALKDFNERGHE